MKHFVTLVFVVFLFGTTFSQKNIKTQVLEKHPTILNDFLSDYLIFSMDMSMLNQTAKNSSGNAQIELNIGARHAWNLVLSPNDLRASSYVSIIATDKGQKLMPNSAVHTYKGHCNGNTENIVRLTIKEDYISGYIKEGGEVWFVEPLRNFTKDSSTEFIVYNAGSVTTKSTYSCAATRLDKGMDMIDKEQQEKTVATGGCLQLEVATEADYEYYQLYGTGTNDLILSILNEVEGAYSQAFQLDIQVTYQRAFATSNDPYVDSISTYILSGFRTHWEQNMDNVPRDVAHFWTGKDIEGSTVGIAYVGATCTTPSFSYGVSQNIGDFAYSRFVLTAHEIGHNLGGSHSHGEACGGTGSIMCPGVQPGAFYFSSAAIGAISNKFNTSPACFIGKPSELNAEVNCTTAHLSWEGASLDDYEIRVRLIGSLNWTTYYAQSNSFLLENMPTGDYEFQVKQTCADGASGFSTSTLFSPKEYIDLQISVLLEGAYDATEGRMIPNLNDLDLLPGQNAGTPAGQPYSQTPWNYYGQEGLGWTNTDYEAIEANNDGEKVVDWVLTSFRTSPNPADEVKRAAGLLLENGRIVYPNSNLFAANSAIPMYVVIEHRNHMGIMTPQMVNTESCELKYDFSAQDSYTVSDDLGFGQTPMISGVWVMHTGDGDQNSDQVSYDITGFDKGIWKPMNGDSYIYSNADYNMDGDVNGNDKGRWTENNGKASRVLKSY